MAAGSGGALDRAAKWIRPIYIEILAKEPNDLDLG
jgi:hypothetical protein